MGASEPFDLGGGAEVGVVCIHGFTGSPYEMRYLGGELAAAGFTAAGPRLPGHGTSVDDLDGTTWQDWVAAVDQAIDAMARRCRRVCVVGQSLGGLLALHAAARRPELAAVASLAAPLWLGGLAGSLAPRLIGRVRLLPKLGGSDVRDPEARAENPSYRQVPTRALGELLAYLPVVDAALPQIAAPVLVLHALHDHTAPVACAYRIATRARARRLRLLPRSYHLIAIDVERALVAREVIDFVRQHAR